MCKVDLLIEKYLILVKAQKPCVLTPVSVLKENSVFFKPRPYFWHEIRSSTHQEQFGESRRPSKGI